MAKRMEHLQIDEAEPEPELVAVRIVKAKGESALVEWDDGRIHRAYVPAKALRGLQCPKDVLGEAPVHGVPWELLLDLSDITPDAVADKLRRRGIWTTEDAHTQSRMLLTIGSGFIGGPVFRVTKELEAKKRGGKK